ncbi:hypothetical protein AHAS_Ahas05G0115000 [Arachis hypogaea]
MGLRRRLIETRPLGLFFSVSFSTIPSILTFVLFLISIKSHLLFDASSIIQSHLPPQIQSSFPPVAPLLSSTTLVPILPFSF